MPYSNKTMRVLRLRAGLDENDKTQDAQLQAIASEDVLREMAGWHLGNPGWADTFLGWIESVGGEVVWTQTKEKI